MELTDYKQTVANYKSTYQKRMLTFLKTHEDAGVDKSDFIYEELQIWKEVEMELLRDRMFFIEQKLNGEYTNSTYIYLAKESLGSNGDKILKYRSRAIIAFLTEKLKSQSIKLEKSKPTKELEYNTNFWNKECFDLFKYLIANYENEGNVKYINIYYFLKQIAKDHQETYRFNMQINADYKPLVKSTYNIAITKFAKARFKYDETELPILKDLEKKFKKTI